MYEAIKFNVRMEDLYADHIDAYRLPETTAAELFMCSLQFGRRVCALRRHFGSTQLLYRVTGKLHIVTHCCFLSKFIHPRFGACWSGEDFMRVTRTSQRIAMLPWFGILPGRSAPPESCEQSDAALQQCFVAFVTSTRGWPSITYDLKTIVNALLSLLHGETFFFHCEAIVMLQCASNCECCIAILAL